jgi:hypothetical protein
MFQPAGSDDRDSGGVGDPPSQWPKAIPPKKTARRISTASITIRIDCNTDGRFGLGVGSGDVTAYSAATEKDDSCALR